MPDMRLAGCRSRPLIGYLKALGLLRILSAQADRRTRGRWSDGAFELRTDLSEDELTDFLLDRYAPSPVVSPWNGGSGFHPKDRKEAIDALEQTDQPRFAAYKSTIRTAREALSSLGITDKPSSESKLPLVREMRRHVPDEALPWLDAAIIVTGEKVSYPPLLGSGGNDGRYDFSNNYAQAIVQCLISSTREDSLASLATALQGGTSTLQRKLSLGHLSRDSSPNNSPYGEADSLGNPWDLLLAVEGTLLLVAGAARRHGAALGSALVAPFTVYSTAAGYGSAVSGESGRAEMWLPLWSQWATCTEIEMLARESRAQVGRGGSRRQARTGLDFARAAGALGVARGIDAFERYAILERAGQANLAVPAGRMPVSERPGAAAIQSIDRWLTDVLKFGKNDNCPAEIASTIRRLERSSFALASRGSPEDACSALEAIGAVEHALARSRSATEARGIRPLRHADAEPWIEAANDRTPEFAVAASIASLHDRKRRSPALRDYLHGTQDDGSSFDAERRHAVQAGGPIQLLAAIHARRHLDAARSDASERGDRATAPEGRPAVAQDDVRHPLEFDYGMPCDARTARLLADGQLDERRILRLVYGLALLTHRTPSSIEVATFGSEAAAPLFDVLTAAWMGHRLWNLPREAREMLVPRRGLAARLAVGAIAPVVADATLRLRLSGQPPIFTPHDLLARHSDARLGPRLSAALLLRLSAKDLHEVMDRITVGRHSDDKNEQRKEIA